MYLARGAQWSPSMHAFPNTSHNPDLEIAINVAKVALDLAERGRVPAGEIARLRGVIARLERGGR